MARARSDRIEHVVAGAVWDANVEDRRVDRPAGEPEARGPHVARVEHLEAVLLETPRQGRRRLLVVFEKEDPHRLPTPRRPFPRFASREPIGSARPASRGVRARR